MYQTGLDAYAQEAAEWLVAAQHVTGSVAEVQQELVDQHNQLFPRAVTTTGAV
jgi:hypothetical protein